MNKAHYPAFHAASEERWGFRPVVVGLSERRVEGGSGRGWTFSLRKRQSGWDKIRGYEALIESNTDGDYPDDFAIHYRGMAA